MVFNHLAPSFKNFNLPLCSLELFKLNIQTYATVGQMNAPLNDYWNISDGLFCSEEEHVSSAETSGHNSKKGWIKENQNFPSLNN